MNITNTIKYYPPDKIYIEVIKVLIISKIGVNIRNSIIGRIIHFRKNFRHRIVYSKFGFVFKIGKRFRKDQKSLSFG
jgi:hypothetical protein